MNSLRKTLKNIRLKINKIGSNKRNKKLKSNDFSIISNNCFAGIFYQHLGLQYNTPTIGLYFYPKEYIKFLKKFDFYIKQPLNFIKTNESKYYDELCKNGYNNVIVGILKDVEIVFLHYKTEEEARIKWEKRCKRLSKNIIFKFNDQNGCTYKDLKEFDELKYDNKLLFTSKNYEELKSNIFIRKYKNSKNIKEDYYSCYKYIDLISYINKKVFRKKILHIIPTYNYSGAENVSITIINSLKYKYDFDYCSFDGNTKNILKENDINFLCIDKFNLSSVNKIIKKGKYDIVHAHDYRASFICSLLKKNFKLVSHLHNNSPWLKKICINTFALLFIGLKSDRILTVSPSIENEYIFTKLIKKRIMCVRNPISRENILNKVDIKNDEKIFDLCCVARITEQKNPGKFLNILNEIRKKLPNIKAVWVGDGNLIKEINKKCEQMNLANNIKFVGYQKNPYNYMQQSKVFLLTSDWEGYGLVAFEALTLGLPCVVSNVGGLPEIVDNDSGRLCTNVNQYVEECINLISDKKYYIQKSENAIKKSKNIENIEKYMSIIIKIYDEL